MPQLDVHTNPGATKGGYPYLLVLQSSLFRTGERWVVIPMAPAARFPVHDARLTPSFDVDGAPHVLVTMGITNIPRERLGAVVGNLGGESERIIDAVNWMMNRGWS